MQAYPLTERNCQSTQVWAQAEYCAAATRGMGFSAHGHLWYYNNRGKVTALSVAGEKPLVVWQGDCLESGNWIEFARRRTGNLETSIYDV